MIGVGCLEDRSPSAEIFIDNLLWQLMKSDAGRLQTVSWYNTTPERQTWQRQSCWQGASPPTTGARSWRIFLQDNFWFYSNTFYLHQNYYTNLSYNTYTQACTILFISSLIESTRFKWGLELGIVEVGGTDWILFLLLQQPLVTCHISSLLIIPLISFDPPFAWSRLPPFHSQ